MKTSKQQRSGQTARQKTPTQHKYAVIWDVNLPVTAHGFSPKWLTHQLNHCSRQHFHFDDVGHLAYCSSSAEAGVIRMLRNASPTEKPTSIHGLLKKGVRGMSTHCVGGRI